MTDVEHVPMTDEVLDAHRKGHEERGSTFLVYFPKQAPWDLMESMQEEMVAIAFETIHDGEWDCFVYGKIGEVHELPEVLKMARALAHQEHQVDCWDRLSLDEKVNYAEKAEGLIALLTPPPIEW